MSKKKKSKKKSRKIYSWGRCGAGSHIFSNGCSGTLYSKEKPGVGWAKCDKCGESERFGGSSATD